MNRTLIIIPIHREPLTMDERASLNRTKKVLRHRHISFMAPEHMREFLTARGHDAFYFPDECMDSRLSYNKLFLNPDFYARFEAFEYILVCQLDVFVFSDKLDEFCHMGYDYIGAPSILRRSPEGRYELYGGNGGFSLRRISAIRALLTRHADVAGRWTGLEDEFFSYCGEQYPDEFHVAPFHVAKAFAFDRFSRYLYRANHFQFPMAKHAWLIYDVAFTQQLLSDAGIPLRIAREDSQSMEQSLSALHEFLSANDHVYVYGAGMWGGDLGNYIARSGNRLEGFIISDGQPMDSPVLHEHPVRFLSSVAGPPAGSGVIVAISRRFIDESEYDGIVGNIQKKGFRHVMLMDAVLYNAIGESLLEQRWKDEGA